MRTLYTLLLVAVLIAAVANARAGDKQVAFVYKTGNLAIEDTSVGSSGLEIVMGVPVNDPGSGLGDGADSFLVGSYRYDLMSDVLNNINIGANGTAFIINQEGVVMAHRDHGKVYGAEPITASLGLGQDAQEVIRLMKETDGDEEGQRDAALPVYFP